MHSKGAAGIAWGSPPQGRGWQSGEGWCQSWFYFSVAQSKSTSETTRQQLFHLFNMKPSTDDKKTHKSSKDPQRTPALHWYLCITVGPDSCGFKPPAWNQKPKITEDPGTIPELFFFSLLFWFKCSHYYGELALCKMCTKILWNQTQKNPTNTKSRTVLAVSPDLCLSSWSPPSSLVLRACDLAGNLHTQALNLKPYTKASIQFWGIQLLVYVSLLYRFLKTAVYWILWYQ